MRHHEEHLLHAYSQALVLAIEAVDKCLNANFPGLFNKLVHLSGATAADPRPKDSGMVRLDCHPEQLDQALRALHNAPLRLGLVVDSPNSETICNDTLLV